MYIVTVNGIDHRVEAKGLSVEQGTLIFYCDDNSTQSRMVVPSGKWEMLKVSEESDALQVKKSTPSETPVEEK
jgi:hypothetical protein